MSNTEALKELFQDALKEDWEAHKNPDTVMIPMTLSRDTGIHMAVHGESIKQLLDLLDGCQLTEDVSMITNAYGDTALHEAAIAGNLEAVKLFTTYMPNLSIVRNNAGETPLFKAAAYGRKEIVNHLAYFVPYFQITEDNKLPEDNQLPTIHRQRPKDGTSILHIAVQGEHFDTALVLLEWDSSLGPLEGKNGMACLQLLANMPSAFKSGYHMGILKSIFYWGLPNDDDDDDDDEVSHVRANDTRAHLAALASSINLSIWRLLCRGFPRIKKFWEAKKKHEYALKLDKKLIKDNHSWGEKHTITDDSSLYYSSVELEEENNENGDFALKLAKLLMKEKMSLVKETELECQRIIEIEECESKFPTSAQGKRERQPQNKTETPLLLATRHGIIEIVKEILKKYPKAVEHCSHLGQNILHLAIKHRQKEIFDHVKDIKIPMTRLVQRIDNNGYTILHHAAGLDTKGTRPGPALQLQEELKWFKRVEKHIPTHYARHVDRKGKTANHLFKEKHEDQLKKEQKWIKETSQSCSAVAVLIATVLFAAAYTMPGGPDDNGVPIFLHSPFFLFFTIMDVVSLASSLTSVVMFLSILTSPCEQKDFLSSLPRKLTLGFTLLFFSVATTMLAFAATIVLIIRLNHKRWTTILIYVSAFFPVTVLALMQFPLYAAFMGTLKGSFIKVMNFVSRLFCKKKLIN